MLRRFLFLGVVALLMAIAACADDPTTGPQPDPIRPADPGLSFALGCLTTPPIENPVSSGQSFIKVLPDPIFLPAGEENYMLSDDYIFGVEISGTFLAFPAKILNWHVIANFSVGEARYHATWCPLSFSYLLVRNEHWETDDADKASFLVSDTQVMGNTLLMRDVETRSVWSQIVAMSISGPRRDACLEIERNTVATSWEAWNRLHPDTFVLTNQAGKQLGIDPSFYETNPYEDYWAGLVEPPSRIFREDDRLPRQTIVLGVHGDGGRAAVIMDGSVGTTTVGNSPVVLFRDPETEMLFAFENNLEGKVRSFAAAGLDGNGFPRFRDTEGTVWTLEGIAVNGPKAGKRLAQMPTMRVYWFVWASFFPDTPILLL